MGVTKSYHTTLGCSVTNSTNVGNIIQSAPYLVAIFIGSILILRIKESLNIR